MQLTHHWVQRAGAHAAAVLSGRPSPGEVTVDALAERIVADAMMAARAEKWGPGYGWQLALAACYPNAPATHPRRGGWSDAELRARLADLFVPDEPGGEWPCWCCQSPTSTRWGKDRWPLAAPLGQLNTAQRDDQGRAWGGVAVCRACRISAWLLPYASATDGGHMITVDSPDLGLERMVAERHVERALAAISEGWQRWPTGRLGAAVWEVLAEHPAQVTVVWWRNDNREPVVREHVVEEPVACWWAGLSVGERELVRASVPLWLLGDVSRLVRGLAGAAGDAVGAGRVGEAGVWGVLGWRLSTMMHAGD